jgi:hypothetical protein
VSSQKHDVQPLFDPSPFAPSRLSDPAVLDHSLRIFLQRRRSHRRSSAYSNSKLLRFFDCKLQESRDLLYFKTPASNSLGSYPLFGPRRLSRVEKHVDGFETRKAAFKEGLYCCDRLQGEPKIRHGNKCKMTRYQYQTKKISSPVSKVNGLILMGNECRLSNFWKFYQCQCQGAGRARNSSG